MSKPHGFTYTRQKNGEIAISHHRRLAVVLRGRKAEQFVDRVAEGDPQEVMARFTGNYKRGNERRSTG